MQKEAGKQHKGGRTNQTKQRHPEINHNNPNHLKPGNYLILALLRL